MVTDKREIIKDSKTVTMEQFCQYPRIQLHGVKYFTKVFNPNIQIRIKNPGFTVQELILCPWCENLQSCCQQINHRCMWYVERVVGRKIVIQTYTLLVIQCNHVPRELILRIPVATRHVEHSLLTYLPASRVVLNRTAWLPRVTGYFSVYTQVH